METQPIRVLLIDDEERFVLNLAKLMRGRGFEVFTAFDGPSGVAAAEQGVDVVVLDVKMPGMGGVEALQRIKEAAPETEVLMLTGHADVETGIEAMRAGALDYLMKPCDIEDLVAKVREAHEIEGIKRRPVLWPRRLVKEITWPSFVRLEAEDPLAKALEVFTRQAGISARDELYILDAEDRLQGVVTRRDLVAAAQPDPPRPFLSWEELAAHPQWLPDRPLAGVMRPGHPAAADPEADLAETARRMLEAKVRCLPVVENGRVTGIVRLKDVLTHLAR
ncbi:MAG: response regulator [Desulfobacterales bacterium]|jgi:ActR/RegA family two-component response regulator|nr:response regulator [Desulfobacterales bacterium]